MREKRITYAVDRETGLVVSRFGNSFAWPVLDFAGMLPENGWKMVYNLERFELDSLMVSSLGGLTWTRKLPLEVKNMHRKFWNLPPVAPSEKYCPLCGEHIKKDKCKKEATA